MVREEYGIVQPQCKKVHKEPPPVCAIPVHVRNSSGPDFFFCWCFWQDFGPAGVEVNWEALVDTHGHGVFFGGGNTGVRGDVQAHWSLWQAKYGSRKHIPRWHTCARGSTSWCRGPSWWLQLWARLCLLRRHHTALAGDWASFLDRA